jgi:hypothetical protein
MAMEGSAGRGPNREDRCFVLLLAAGPSLLSWSREPPGTNLSPTSPGTADGGRFMGDNVWL